MTIKEDQLLRTGEVALRLRRSAARVHQLRDEGALPAIKTPLGFLYRESDVQRLEAGRRKRAEVASGAHQEEEGE